MYLNTNREGGGWSLLVFNLGALYQEWEHLRNAWSKSNLGLNLVRYLYSDFKFYRHDTVDYVVTAQTCYPMLDNKYMHANCHPSRMLLAKRKIIVPSKKTNPNGRPYKRKRFYPPEQMLNKWFFQKEMCNTNLLMLATTACDLMHYYVPSTAESNNITLYSINTKIFQNKNFQHTEQGTVPWSPKASYYMYGQHNGSTSQPTKASDLIYLGNTYDNTGGQTSDGTFNAAMKKENMGNPFFHEYISGDRQIWVGNIQPSAIFKTNISSPEQTANLKKLHLMQEPIIVTCRYNPNRDTGEGNRVYMLSNIRQDNGYNPPNDPNLTIDGFPLWLSMWGWADWQKKLSLIQQIDINYFIACNCSFIDPPLPCYVFLSKSFIDGEGPYQLPRAEISASDNQHWYPKYKFQKEGIENINMSGPAVAKSEYTKNIEAHCEYKFKFKWGGCPADIETPYDPCEQPQYNVPDKQLLATTLQDPTLSPDRIFHDFDIRRGEITQTALERVCKYKKTDKPLFTDGTTPCEEKSLFDPPIQPQETLQTLLQELHQTSSSEEDEETPIPQQLQRHKLKQQRLKHKLLKLIKKATALE